MTSRLFGCVAAALLAVASSSCSTESRVPDKLVVLTFDDGNKTDRDFVGPLLKEFGFGGTFFVNKSGGAFGHPERFMTWDDVRWLHDAGFEIGNHTANHRDVRDLSREEFAAELDVVEVGCAEHGIPRPTSFCFCGYRVSRDAVNVLEERGYLFARRGVSPEFHMTDRGDRGPTYSPASDHPLLIPTTGASGPSWTAFEEFVSIVNQAKDGHIVVLTFHGIPTDLHPWVHTDPETFRRYMDYLRDEGFTAIAMRDLARWVDRRSVPEDPFAPIDRRLRIVPVDLACEPKDEASQLTFRWACRSSCGQEQSAYQILVASSEENSAAVKRRPSS